MINSPLLPNHCRAAHPARSLQHSREWIIAFKSHKSMTEVLSYIKHNAVINHLLNDRPLGKLGNITMRKACFG